MLNIPMHPAMSVEQGGRVFKHINTFKLNNGKILDPEMLCLASPGSEDTECNILECQIGEGTIEHIVFLCEVM